MGGGDLRRDARGASLGEYAILVSLVMLVSVGAWAALGVETSDQADCVAVAVQSGAGGAPCRASSDSASTPVPGDTARETRAGRDDEVAAPAQPSPGSAPVEPPHDEGGPLDGIFAFGGGFVSGFVDGGVSMVTSTIGLGAAALGGTGYAVTHPAEAVDATLHVATHLDQAVPAAVGTGEALVGGVWQGVQDAGDTLVNGTWQERGRLFGGATFEVGSSFVPISKLGKLGQLAKLGDHAEDAARTSETAHDLLLAAGRTKRTEDTTRDIIARNVFTAGRDLDEYRKRLGGPFTRKLDSLGPDDHWIDFGAGDAQAIRDLQALRGAQAPHMTALGYTAPRDPAFAAFAEETPTFRGLFGRMLEDYAPGEIRRADLVTDVYGPFAYAERADDVLSRYASMTKVGGEIHIHLGPETTIRSAGEFMPPHEVLEQWIASSRGLELIEIWPDAYRIGTSAPPPYYQLAVRVTSEDVSVAPLRLTRPPVPGSPPTRAYAWDPRDALPR